MIHLISGLPGSGKSLRTVWYIHQFLKDGRPVYAFGVDGLNVPGVMPCDDPNAWESLPDGAVIVIDEAQKVWPSRRGAEPIPPVRALSEHRHQGKDFILITQHPAMLDSYVRRLVGRHEHLVRKFGIAAAQVFSWNEVQDDPQQSSARELAEESLWSYPKDLFGQYKSATLHTVKRRVPKALIVVVAALLAIPAMGYAAYSIIGSWSDPSANAAPEADSAGLPALSADGPGRAADPPESDVIDYAALYTPRIPGVAWSAPAYDGFEVQDYPRPHCIIVGDQRVERIRCRCYTQQATPMDVEDRMCVTMARHGVWDPRRRPLEAAEPNDQPDHSVQPLEVQVSGIRGWDRSIDTAGIPEQFSRTN